MVYLYNLIVHFFAIQINLVHGSSIVEEELSAAAGNLTIFKTKIASPWVQGPKARGTSDILWSCIVTLTACIYTAIHLNVPPAHEGKWNFIWRKTKWVGLALLAPEIVLYCAYNQFAKARKLVKELNELRGAQGDVEQARADFQDGMVAPVKNFPLRYGFFVVMGGITTPSVTEITDDPNPPRTLGPCAIVFFARRGFFFDVSSDEIMDKSKANMLGKALICVQVLWFAVQTIARAAAGYPLTLIEIHTMVHVLCALAMYILWWEKPQDVLEPVARNITNHYDILAALYVMFGSSYMEKEAFELQYYGTLNVQPQTQDQATSTEDNDQSHQVVIIDQSFPPCQTIPPVRQGGNDLCALLGGQALHSLIGPNSHLRLRRLAPKPKPKYLSAKDVRRWNYLSKLLHQSYLPEGVDRQILHNLSTYNLSADDINIGSNPGTNVFYLLCNIDILYRNDENLAFHQPNFLEHTRGNFFEKVLNMIGNSILSLLLIALPIAYGGIHLAAWNFQFASNIEHLLWKIACIIIMTTCIAITMTFLCLSLLEELTRKFRLFSIKQILAFLREKTPFVLLSFYSLSRTYLLIESFISLRYAPIGVFATVPWVQSIPHI